MRKYWKNVKNTKTIVANRYNFQILIPSPQVTKSEERETWETLWGTLSRLIEWSGSLMSASSSSAGRFHTFICASWPTVTKNSPALSSTDKPMCIFKIYSFFCKQYFLSWFFPVHQINLFAHYFTGPLPLMIKIGSKNSNFIVLNCK